MGPPQGCRSGLTGRARLRSGIGPVVAVWLVAFNLRAVIWGLSPTLPALRMSLQLSSGEIGLLGSLPTLCLAAGAIPGALLVRVFGFHRCIGVSLVGIAVGTSARLLPPALMWVAVGTGLLSLGVGITQPAVAVAIREWFPRRIGRTTSIYANGLSIGSLVGSSVTPYLVLAGGWRLALGVWAVPVAAVGVVWHRVRTLPRVTRERISFPFRSLLKNGEIWRAAVLFGGQNLAFSTALIWLPFLIGGRNPTTLALGLLAMNSSIVFPSLWLGLSRHRFLGHRAFYIGGASVSTLGACGLMLSLRPVAWLCASMVGLGTGLVAIGALTLPSARGTSPEWVSSYSALMLTLGYGLSIFGPAVGGLIVQRTGYVGSAFIPAIFGSILMGLFGIFIADDLREVLLP